MNLDEIFSEARSGTIAHKNKKRIGVPYHTPLALRFYFCVFQKNNNRGGMRKGGERKGKRREKKDGG
jgi:hypothetical protein